MNATASRGAALSLVVAFAAIPCPAQPPAKYDLKDVVIRYTQDNPPLLAVPDPCDTEPRSIEVMLRGSGQLVVERRYLEDKQCPDSFLQSELPSAEFRSLLNEIYRARFFELGDSYSNQPGVHIRDDGYVMEVILVASDVAEFALSVEIGDFNKAVELTAGAEQAGLRPVFEAIRRLSRIR